MPKAYLLCMLGLLALDAQGKEYPAPRPDDQLITWFDGETPRTFRQATEEVAVLGRPGARSDIPLRETARQLFPGADVVESRRGFVRLRLERALSRPELSSAQQAAPAFPGVARVSPVFYDRRAPDKSPAQSKAAYVLSGGMVVQFAATTDAAQAAAWGRRNGFELREPTAIAGAYLFACPDDAECIGQANRAYADPDVRYAFPDWIRPRAPRAFSADDPRYTDQWHLLNTGQSGGTSGEDANVLDAWLDYDGSGVTVAIVDDGLEIAHEDLSANVLAGRSHDYFDDDDDPTPVDGDSGHGTACAGVTAARGGNGIGVTGVAPRASLVGFNVLQESTDTNEADALTRAEDVVDISSNSWGPIDALHYQAGPGPLAEQALAAGAADGRAGKGTIYVWAGGNGEDADNANLDGYANSRFTIAVAASDHNGVRSYYSEPGANLHVTAPSSGGGAGITTVDLTGDGGYSTEAYTDHFGGTSSAAPLVAGVAALVLEANPALTWRDVQAVLISSAAKNDPTHSDWTRNAAGYWVNHVYGFGRVDAAAAVATAEAWTPLGPELHASQSRTPALPIPDNDPAGVSDTLALRENLTIESVDVFFDSDTTYAGDLYITLTSPQGTEAVLTHNIIGNSGSYDDWRFGVARFFGETSAGTWTLEVSDRFSDDTGSLLSWGIEVHGTAVDTGADSDGDGMPDSWEIQYGLDPHSAADARTDADADGYANYYEYRGESDPTDPASVPTTAACSGTDVTVSARTYAAGEWVLCEAQNSITGSASVTLQAGAEVIFVAPSIRLQPGFTVEPGAVFHAGASLP